MLSLQAGKNAKVKTEGSRSSFSHLSLPTRPFALQRQENTTEITGTVPRTMGTTFNFLPGEFKPLSTSPIQFLRGSEQFSNDMKKSGANMSNQHLQKVHSALNAYHSKSREDFDSDQEYSNHRAKALDDMEHGSYKYFHSIKSAKPTDPHYSTMLNMLDEIQQAHIEHVDYIHKKNLKLHAKGLEEDEEDQLNKNWDSIRKGTGLIKLPQGEQHEQTNKEVRAMYARLLSRPSGRKLINQLLEKEDEEDDRTITHQYSERDTSSPQKQQEKRRNKEHFQTVVKPRYEKTEKNLRELFTKNEKIHGNNPKKWPEKLQKEWELALQEKDKARISLLEYMDEKNPKYKDITSEEPARASEESGTGEGYPGKGSKIHILKGLRDSENLSHDSEGNLVPAPAFITFGHELVHALHNKKGTRDISTDSERYEYGGDLSKWGNREEHQTIAKGVGAPLSENELREEHGITPREGHTSKSRLDLEREKAEQDYITKRNWGIGLGTLALLGGALGYYYKYIKK